MSKLKLFLTLIILTGIIGLQACATIFGGAKYTAYVHTNDRDAVILIDGQKKGIGKAEFLQKRNRDLKLEVESEKCDNFDYTYGKRLRGTIFLNLLWGYYIILPAVITDIATGSMYKPDMRHPGVDKVSIDSYRYTIDLENCKSEL